MSAGGPGEPRYDPGWLALREPADAAARAVALLDPLRRALAGRTPLLLCDLGCGTGAMGRWLAPRLPGPQHWVLYDHDPALLARAAAGLPERVGGGPVTAETRRADLGELTAADLAGASLVTGSALLDLLTRAEVDRLARLCTELRCPALVTLSVAGEVELTPADPLDERLRAAFNDHQRRPGRRGRLLGPEAVTAAAEAFGARGARVRVEPSPWRLGPDHPALLTAWLRGWVAAACEQAPELAAPAAGYLERRLAAAAAGTLRAVVGHRDLLALPGAPPAGGAPPGTPPPGTPPPGTAPPPTTAPPTTAPPMTPPPT